MRYAAIIPTHNHGAVMAAAIDLDTIGAAAVNENGSVRLFSEGYGLTETMSDANESDVKRGTSASLVAGMCDSLRHEGYECGGFDVWCTSQVLEGSGLSSSASFEVFVGTVINHLFNCGSIDPVTCGARSTAGGECFLWQALRAYGSNGMRGGWLCFH